MAGIESVVLVSGGMDSCLTAALALRDLALKGDAGPASDLAAFLHVTYGQRTAARERRAFDEISDFYQVRTRMVADIGYLKAMGGSALTDGRIDVPVDGSGLEPASDRGSPGGPNLDRSLGRSIPITYVPFRNTHLLAIAVSWAEVLGAGQIYIGAVAEDSSGYPDCRPEYYRAFNALIGVGTRPETRVEVRTPVIGLRKVEIVERGRTFGAPFHLTWSCYQNEDMACGKCDSCRLRRRAFEQAGVEDPISYSTSDGMKSPGMGARNV